MDRREGIALCLAAAALLALSAQPAAAAKKKAPGKLKTASATVNTSVDDQVVTATATCPQGTTAVGGGFAAGSSGEAGELSDINFVTETRRASKTSWTVGAFRLDAGAAGPTLPLTAEAYCRSGAGKISEVSSSSAAPNATSFLASSAGCPLGRVAVGGGFKLTVSSITGLSFALLASRPLGLVGWTSNGVGVAPGASSLASYAYCRKGKTKAASRSAAIPLAPSNLTVSSGATPACPAKLKPFTGGFEGSPFYPSSPFAAVVESRRSGGGWRVGALSLNEFAGTFNAHATCS